MRFQVNDDFAIALSEKMYELLLDKEESLPRAVGLALRDLENSAQAFPALSVVTPALFGGRAVDLRLSPPGQVIPARRDIAVSKMAGFQTSRSVS